MIQPVKKKSIQSIEPKPANDNFIQLDITKFITGIFKEHLYRGSLKEEDWTKYQDQRVLIKSCRSGPIPPWAFMLLLSHLVPYARMVAYGEDCAPIVVYRKKGEEETF